MAEAVAERATPSKTGRVARVRRPRNRRPVVITEKLFRDVLVRERKRADRFAQPFVLVLVVARADRSDDSSMWATVIEALTAIRRDTDVLGWFEHGSAFGMVVPEIDTLDASCAREIDSRVSGALASRLNSEALADVSVRVHRYSGLTAARPFEVASPLRDLHVSPRARVQAVLKRILDIGASAVLLVLASPLFFLIALFIKSTSRGPVFFRQPRVGEHGKLFTMLKFRTMHVHADSTIHKEFVSQMIQGATPAGVDPGQDAPFKIANDPRVTTGGSLLRRTSLDELPQLWNVLRGDMSLVGPRPPLTYEVEQYKPWHYRRVLEAKPGITGLWQVSGRSRTTFDDMVRLDLRYARKRSAWMDLKILLATPRAVFLGKGAR